VSKVVAESGLSGLVESVRNAYKYFERDEEVDKLYRDDFVARIESTPPHTSDERRLLMKTLSYADYRLIGGRVEKAKTLAGWTATCELKQRCT